MSKYRKEIFGFGFGIGMQRLPVLAEILVSDVHYG